VITGAGFDTKPYDREAQGIGWQDEGVELVTLRSKGFNNVDELKLTSQMTCRRKNP